MYHDFVIPEEYHWENIRKDVNNLPEKFSQGLKVLAEKNPELKDILDNADFIQFTNNRENSEILRQLVELFSEKNFIMFRQIFWEMLMNGCSATLLRRRQRKAKFIHQEK